MAGSTRQKTFGKTVRALRTEAGISLRKFAERVNVTPTYLSKIEREEFPPPAEDKVVAIAKELGQDPDEFLALAGRVATELDGIIRQRPREMADFLRAAKGLSREQLERLTEDARKRKRSRSSRS